MKKLIQCLIAALYIASFGALLSHLQAEETTAERAQTKVDEFGKDAKQEGRKVKRKVRDATDTESPKEDIKDAAKDAKDEIEFQGEKTKRKID